METATGLSVVEQSLIEIQELQHRSAGAVLFRAGDPPRGVYIVHSGAIDLVFSAKNGLEKPLQVAEAGQIVGLSSVVSGRAHGCTAVVRTAAELGFVEADALRHLLDTNPGAWFSVLQFLSVNLNSCWDSMRTIGAR